MPGQLAVPATGKGCSAACVAAAAQEAAPGHWRRRPQVSLHPHTRSPAQGLKDRTARRQRFVLDCRPLARGSRKDGGISSPPSAPFGAFAVSRGHGSCLECEGSLRAVERPLDQTELELCVLPSPKAAFGPADPSLTHYSPPVPGLPALPAPRVPPPVSGPSLVPRALPGARPGPQPVPCGKRRRGRGSAQGACPEGPARLPLGSRPAAPNPATQEAERRLCRAGALLSLV